jgi:hypothetical protein
MLASLLSALGAVVLAQQVQALPQVALLAGLTTSCRC